MMQASLRASHINDPDTKNIIAGKDLHLTYGLYSPRFRVFTSSTTGATFSARSLDPRMPTNRQLLHPRGFVFTSTITPTEFYHLMDERPMSIPPPQLNSSSN